MGVAVWYGASWGCERVREVAEGLAVVFLRWVLGSGVVEVACGVGSVFLAIGAR